jgi:hypothetical protein
MRRQLRKFLPIVLVALAVQVLAPIAACWAAGIAASDPLGVTFICHDNAGPVTGQGDQTGDFPPHDGCCSVCNLSQTGAPVDAPQTAVAMPGLQSNQVVWLERVRDAIGARAGSNSQARAPPQLT